MAENGCSEFFLTIFPKKTGINSEWPKMCILNLFKPFWYVQKDWKKFGMNKNGHSEFIQTFLVQKILEEIWNGQNSKFIQICNGMLWS